MKNAPSTIGLDENQLDIVYEHIINGRTYRDIADMYSVTLMMLFKFLYDPKHYVRTKEALEFSAHVMMDQAEAVLAQAKDNPQLLMVAGMLAHHYRWKASMLNKRQYNNNEKYHELAKGVKKEITIRVIEE